MPCQKGKLPDRIISFLLKSKYINKLLIDDEGYLVNFEDWNEKVACALADREGVSKICPVTKEKIEILKFMRDYYKKFNAFPISRFVCKNLHQPKECTYEEFAGPPNLQPEVYATLKKLKVE